MSHFRFAARFPLSPRERGRGEGENTSNTLGDLRGELKDSGKKKRISFGKCVLEIGFIKKILLAVYNKMAHE